MSIMAAYKISSEIHIYFLVAKQTVTKTITTNDYQTVLPPSIVKQDPVIYRDASEHRKTMADLYSLGSAILTIGINSDNLLTNYIS